MQLNSNWWLNLRTFQVNLILFVCKIKIERWSWIIQEIASKVFLKFIHMICACCNEETEDISVKFEVLFQVLL